jgi:hypothetical protein
MSISYDFIVGGRFRLRVLLFPNFGLIMENGVEKRLVNLNCFVVIDETQFAELVHEKADTRPRRTNHFRQRLLIESDGRAVLLSIVCKKQASEPPLTRIEKLVDYFRLFRLKRWSMNSLQNFGSSRIAESMATFQLR